MKRITNAPKVQIVVAVAALVGLSLAGCSSTNSSGTSTSAAGASDIAVGTVGDVTQFSDIASLCGDKPIKVGLVDGYGTNSWSKTVKAEIESEAAKCKNITSVEYAAGAGDLAATTSAITSMAAKGVNITLVIPDAGPGAAHLPAMKTATDAGSIVMAVASDPGAKPGSGYLDYIDQSPEFSGSSWVQWVADQLGTAGGNVVFLGGPDGAAVSTGEFAGIKSVLAKNSQLTLLAPDPVVTNWDPAQAQTAMAGLLAKFPKIDAVITDYGATAAGVIRAYQAAGMSLPIMTSTDDNSLSCGFEALAAANPSYKLATHSSRTWIGRIALRKALASFNGMSDKEPSIYNLGIYEDSTGKAAGSVLPSKACLAGAPADATPSTLLSTAEITKLFAK